MKHIAILGRIPAISIAELESTQSDVRWFSNDTALFEADSFDIQEYGGTVKAGRVISELHIANWHKISSEISKIYSELWANKSGKITLGISVYGLSISTKEIQRTGLILKSELKKSGISLRLIPNSASALSTATSHHNKLGLADNKVELIIVRGHRGDVIIAESTGAQNITALARRDQGRPARDAFVGMLPPKLAQIMINLAQPSRNSETLPVVLDPFCGTGVVLQEAMLLRRSVYGTDLSEKMIRYSRDNLNWLQEQYHMSSPWYLHEGDATTTEWRQPINAVVCETYLGQPFSAPPKTEKLEQVRGNCNHIITEFLKNLAPQIPQGTPLCVAIPAWNNGKDNFTHLPLIKDLKDLGYIQHRFKTVDSKDLLYFRPGQVVAREILVLSKI